MRGKPIKAKARTKTFVHADYNTKMHHDLTVGVIEPVQHVSQVSDTWAFIELRRVGTEFTLDLPLPALEKLHAELGAAIARVRGEPKPCTLAGCYYCKESKESTP